MLQPGASGQWCIGMGLGLTGQSIRQVVQVGFDQVQRGPQLQDQTGVHCVLAGGAKMHITLGFGYATGDHLAQGLDQRDSRIAGTADGFCQRRKIVALRLAGGLDGSHCDLGNQPHGRFGARQGSLEIEHTLHPATVGKHFAHGCCGEVGIEQLIARSRVHLQILQQVNDRGAGTLPVSADAG
ncbi:hypothetical protein D3C80_574160 [compost metagenome]